MKVIPTSIPDVLIIEPRIFNDERGFFFESYNDKKFEDLVGRSTKFVQDNHSFSARRVLRGLHYQIQHQQGKLVRAIQGTILDVAVDIRKSSPTFGKHVMVELSDENNHMLWIPEGFAHGFSVTSNSAEVLYKTTDYWYPEHERCIIWNDDSLKIDWHSDYPILSSKDAKGKSLIEAEIFE